MKDEGTNFKLHQKLFYIATDLLFNMLQKYPHQILWVYQMTNRMSKCYSEFI